MKIRHLFLSSGHNFYGHHGQAAGEHETRAVSEMECVAGKGVVGDRFFDYKPDYKGQITFFDQAVWESLRTEMEVEGKGPEVFRRNVIVEMEDGEELLALVGKEFEVQGVTFSGSEEASPCYWMDVAFAPGAEKLMRGYGGLRARILTDGVLTREEA